jgi:hypothetical protein
MIGSLFIVLLVLMLIWLLLRKRGSGHGRGAAAVAGTRRGVAAGARAGGAKDAILHLDVRSDLAPEPLPEALAGLQLLTVDEVDAAGWEQVARICQAMGDPHPAHARLAGGLETPEALREVVSADGGLTVKVLSTVNSAAFALASPITSVQHAVTYLGVGIVRGLVLRATLAEREEAGTPEQQAAVNAIWKSACSGSALAQLLGQELALPRPSVLATKSLFFNLGDVAIARAVTGAGEWFSGAMGVIERIEAQQRVLGANTAIIGAALARHWNLPEDLALAIEDGYLPLVTRPGEHPMQGEDYRQNVLVYLAGQIGDHVAYRGLQDIADFRIDGSDDPALFHLPGHLEASGLQRVIGLAENATFRRKANRLIATLSPGA